MPTRPSRRALLLGAATLLLCGAPAAQASSLVFIKDHNVWLAEPDGTKLTQVTTDGTADRPYRSPSQADDGTIAVSHIAHVELLQQNGAVIRELDPPALVDSTSHTIKGVPVDVAISPDGARVAYTFVSPGCPVAADCDTRAATGVINAAGDTPPGTYASATYGSPKWVGNGRLLVVGGYLHQINLLDLAAGSTAFHWFDDQEYFGAGSSSDLGDGAVSRDGRRVAAVHGYDGEHPDSFRRLVWFSSPLDARTAPLPLVSPDGVCAAAPLAGTRSPAWAPDGAGLAFAAPDGIHLSAALPTRGEDCGSYAAPLVIPGGSEPDWGPAAIAPAPRPAPPGGGAPGGGTSVPGGGGAPGGGDAGGQPSQDGASSPATLALAGSAKLSRALAAGLRLRVTGAPAGRRVSVRLTVDGRTARRLGLGRRTTTIARGRATASRQGTARLTLRFTSAARRKLRGQRKLTATARMKGGASQRLRLR